MSASKPSLQRPHDLEAKYKTAWVLAHRLREALAPEPADEIAEGEVNIDGVYFDAHFRQENQKAARKDRRIKESQLGRRPVVLALCERNGSTITFVRKPKASRLQRLTLQPSQSSSQMKLPLGRPRLQNETGRINHNGKSPTSHFKKIT